jgi:hypothetical protein
VGKRVVSAQDMSSREQPTRTLEFLNFFKPHPPTYLYQTSKSFVSIERNKLLYHVIKNYLLRTYNT